MCRSLPQIPQRPTLTTTSSAPGVGSGSVSNFSGWCNSWKVTAFNSFFPFRLFAHRHFARIHQQESIEHVDGIGEGDTHACLQVLRIARRGDEARPGGDVAAAEVDAAH